MSRYDVTDLYRMYYYYERSIVIDVPDAHSVYFIWEFVGINEGLSM